METDEIKKRAAYPWVPMSKPKDVKILGKTLEEVNELGSALSRCLIQGINEQHTDGNKTNKQWLEQEIGDVLATVNACIDNFDLDIDHIGERRMLKEEFLEGWFDL